MFENARVFTTDVGRASARGGNRQARAARYRAPAWSATARPSLCATPPSSDKPREGVDFFPLSVDYEEKLYAVGKIPGSFLAPGGPPRPRRRSSTSRMIDRPIRPLFPKDMRNDVSVVCTVMSVDPDCSPEITAMIGASIAISISEIPVERPDLRASASAWWTVNISSIPPTEQQQKAAMAVDGCLDRCDLVAMIEAGADQVDRRGPCLTAIMAGHEANQKIVAVYQGYSEAKIGKPKIDFPSNDSSTRDVRGGQGSRH